MEKGSAGAGWGRGRGWAASCAWMADMSAGVIGRPRLGVVPRGRCCGWGGGGGGRGPAWAALMRAFLSLAWMRT